MKAIIGDSRVNVRPLERSEPPPVSNLDSAAGQRLHIAIRRVFQDAVVLPILTPGTTDSRHYAYAAEEVFRFSPFRMNREDLSRLHGRNERISRLNCELAVRFYMQFLRLASNL